MIAPAEYYNKCVLSKDGDEMVAAISDLIDDIIEMEEELGQNPEKEKLISFLKTQEYLSYTIGRIVFETVPNETEFSFATYFSMFSVPDIIALRVYEEIIDNVDCFILVSGQKEQALPFNVKHFKNSTEVDFDKVWQC